MTDRAWRIVARVIGELRDVRTGISKSACEVLADELEIALKLDGESVEKVLAK